MEMLDYNKTYIDSAVTTQVFSGRGLLVGILVGTTAAGAIGIIDGTSGSTVNVAELVTNVPVGFYPLNCVMAAGCRIVTAAASKITVIWKKN